MGCPTALQHDTIAQARLTVLRMQHVRQCQGLLQGSTLAEVLRDMLCKAGDFIVISSQGTAWTSMQALNLASPAHPSQSGQR